MNSFTNADAAKTHPRLSTPLASSVTCIFSTPIGPLALHIIDEHLVAIDMMSTNTKLIPAKDALSKDIIQQFKAYFRDPHFKFTIPIRLNTTPFQKRMAKVLQTIAPGQALTYKDLAKKLQSAPRAVGQACRRNPLPIIIPCHRIIATTHLGGYSGNKHGAFMEIKKWLLRHEGFLAQ